LKEVEGPKLTLTYNPPSQRAKYKGENMKKSAKPLKRSPNWNSIVTGCGHVACEQSICKQLTLFLNKLQTGEPIGVVLTPKRIKKKTYVEFYTNIYKLYVVFEDEIRLPRENIISMLESRWATSVYDMKELINRRIALIQRFEPEYMGCFGVLANTN